MELKKENNNIEKIQLELEDIKERFVELDKQASIGRLTAGILHEIKNPLNFVINFSKLSIRLINEQKELLESNHQNFNADDKSEFDEISTMLESNINKITENGERAQRLILTMLAQTRKNQETIFEPVDINVLVDEFAKLSYQGMRGMNPNFNVTFNTDYDKSLGKINLGEQEISRVIVNLVNNACYAINEKLKTNPASYSPLLTLSTKQKGDLVEIRIKDNGIGMPQAVIDNLFTPFFTTKPKGQGTGLGLSMSYDIITKIHQGKLEVASQENEFTEFIIQIPLWLK